MQAVYGNIKKQAFATGRFLKNAGITVYKTAVLPVAKTVKKGVDEVVQFTRAIMGVCYDMILAPGAGMAQQMYLGVKSVAKQGKALVLQGSLALKDTMKQFSLIVRQMVRDMFQTMKQIYESLQRVFAGMKPKENK